MKLRQMMVAATLGATVLTAVPAVTASYTAYACEDNQTSCDHEDEENPWPDDNPGGFPGGDPGDGGWGGGDGGGGSGGSWGDIDMFNGVIGQPVDGTLPRVVVDGTATRPPTPMDPAMPPMSWGWGSGAPASGAGPIQAGAKFERPTDCHRNADSMPVRVNRTVKYQWSYETSTNISANAAQVLSATLGAQVNTTFEESYSVDVTLQPGQSWTLFVEYQTFTYSVTSSNILGYVTTEYVNVVRPTGKVTSRWC
ncbi:DUF6426 family protein [Streptomyces sp. NPDC087908]|uniref:DUF6426 family protein n=1 Tax=unclassified Streptomyces TaxID=2593676 RepID=UPI00164F80AF|nr:DUF6426 family protein [Streptomyces sp. adm13(2018)]